MCTIKESPTTSPHVGYVPNCYECFISKSPVPFSTPACCSGAYPNPQHHQQLHHQQQPTLPHPSVVPASANTFYHNASVNSTNNATASQPTQSSSQLSNAIFDLQQFFDNGNETASDCSSSGSSNSSYDSDFFWETIIDLPLSDCASC
eukprot:TRINITY_DN2633_c0_g1_i12.p2 TRINITY_DN2633_c0_g1~~TRINITY_DN2633_c0_g1_i12.p2  ORF type:complete len:148 (+),score=26.90 TRINITY_DN2633_c0_g1_i12:442-885(+)